LRHHLLASGCLLQDARARATYVVEARSGAVGTDRKELLFGIPSMSLPGVVPGVPAGPVPEVPLAKKTDRRGVAKLAVFAYNRKSGQPVWQSGVVQTVSTSKDTWMFAAGPSEQGTLRAGTKRTGPIVHLALRAAPAVARRAVHAAGRVAPDRRGPRPGARRAGHAGQDARGRRRRQAGRRQRAEMTGDGQHDVMRATVNQRPWPFSCACPPRWN